MLHKNHDKRLLAGHQWVFSNEIMSKEEITHDGEVVECYSSSGKFLGKGYYNNRSLIAYRQLTNLDEITDKDFYCRRILEANERRLKVKPERKCYRMVNSESDFLPGLIIDKFENRFSIQTFSKGIDMQLPDIVNILKEDFNAVYIIEKNDNSLRLLEGLERKEEILYRNSETVSDEFVVNIDGIKYNLNLVSGQKTGFYLDQWYNRLNFRNYINKGDEVLDLFCNEGGFALNAAAINSTHVAGIDSSDEAIRKANQNASLNSFNNIKFMKSDVEKYLESTDELYNAIVLDPPSFAKSKNSVNSALHGYVKLMILSFKKLLPNGLLFAYTCSHHITKEMFTSSIAKAANKAGRKIQILETTECTYDHPILPQMKETQYLNGFIIRAL